MSITSQGFNIAKELYSKLGVDLDKAIARVNDIPLSLHCWQGDDVTGFENRGGSLSGGIAVTGNYPYRARTLEELRQDLEEAMKHIPGKLKVNLHAIYLDSQGKKVDRDEITPSHFESWADWAVSNKIGLDFNPTFFSHPKAADGYTLSHRDDDIRNFWIRHAKQSRKISEYFGRRTGIPCVTNIWIPDGEKEVPADTKAPRERLTAALDEILQEKISSEYNIDALESKLFGIGSESYVTGSHEFYLGYVLTRKNAILTVDTGHFHPTEQISAKLSAIYNFCDGLLIHLSRPVRWDSDHVVTYDDELRSIMREIIRTDGLDKTYLALDYFDASINRIIAWIVGARNARKAALEALLEPVELLKEYERNGDRSARLALSEELKTMPFGLVWNYYCEQNGIPKDLEWLEGIKQYEKKVLSKRV